MHNAIEAAIQLFLEQLLFMLQSKKYELYSMYGR